jgi:two-component system, chemotaxis family, CheB/CheR fusion protein
LKSLSVCSPICPPTPALPSYSFNISNQITTACLAKILARATILPVKEAADGMPVEPNHVYVIPANVDLTIADGALKLAPRTQTPGSHMPIDRFLRSVADQCGSRAIGVILSGTGADGSAGVEAIKAAGGVTFAQDAATAKFATMPQAAVATGCVDFILPPESIASELVRLDRTLILRVPYAPNRSEPRPPTKSGSAASWLFCIRRLASTFRCIGRR